MQRCLLDLLVCPETKRPLKLENEVVDKSGRIASAVLVSPEGRRYPIVKYVPRFVDSDKYTTTFSIQRNYLRRRFDDWMQEKGREGRFTLSTGIDLKEVGGLLLLDAGVGYGRFAHTLAEAGAEVVGVDLSSDSIDLAQQYLGERPNVHLVQCDLMCLPFREKVFDAVFSIGVLHHTPDTRAAFESLVPYVKPGGRISAWVYHPRDKRFEDIWRKFTTRLPHHILFGLCVVRAIVYSGYSVVRQGTRGYTQFWPYVMGHFDSLSPKYAHSHTPEELESWFREAEFEECQRLSRRTAVTGIKPAQPSEQTNRFKMSID